MSSRTDYDVGIVGAGPAGLAAGLWCSDLGLRAILVEASAEAGGQLLRTHGQIANYPGLQSTTGRGLRDQFVHQLKHGTCSIRLHTPAPYLDLTSKQIVLRDGSIIRAEALIVASGLRRRRLRIPGESEFVGRGVLQSAVGERDTVRNRRVCVVGGADGAIECAILLSRVCSSVLLVHRGPQLTARHQLLAELASCDNVAVLTGHTMMRILGRTNVEAAELRVIETGETIKCDVDAVLVRIGHQPNTEFLCKQLDLDNQGYIVVENSRATSVSGGGVFAIGDVINPVASTISSAIGDAAVAVKHIAARLAY